MPRPREYNRQTVIERAGAVFHRKGFEATSMSDLVAATGLNTASMYKEFGSKEGLFEATLDNYRSNHIATLTKGMATSPGLQALLAYLENLKTYAQSTDFSGCLLMNNLAEESIASEGTLQRIDSLCHSLESLFRNCLEKAKEAGDIPAAKDVDKLADYILCIVHGITLYARMENRQRNLDGIIDQVVDSIMD